jgi:hypothetical protein
MDMFYQDDVPYIEDEGNDFSNDVPKPRSIVLIAQTGEEG